MEYLAFIICQYDFFSIKRIHSVICQIINIQKEYSISYGRSETKYVLFYVKNIQMTIIYITLKVSNLNLAVPHLKTRRFYLLVFYIKEGLLCNVYINVNLFNDKNLTMSAFTWELTTSGWRYIILQKHKVTNLSPNKLNNISLVVGLFVCVACQKYSSHI